MMVDGTSQQTMFSTPKHLTPNKGKCIFNKKGILHFYREKIVYTDIICIADIFCKVAGFILVLLDGSTTNSIFDDSIL